MSTDSPVSPISGWCFICDQEIDSDVAEHFITEHNVPGVKPRVAILSWRQRLLNVRQAIEEILQESDTNVQIHKMDEDVIKELYLVRARLAQTKRTPALRAKEG